jgi:hypothetical protein
MNDGRSERRNTNEMIVVREWEKRVTWWVMKRASAGWNEIMDDEQRSVGEVKHLTQGSRRLERTVVSTAGHLYASWQSLI